MSLIIIENKTKEPSFLKKHWNTILECAKPVEYTPPADNGKTVSLDTGEINGEVIPNKLKNIFPEHPVEINKQGKNLFILKIFDKTSYAFEQTRKVFSHRSGRPSLNP